MQRSQAPDPAADDTASADRDANAGGARAASAANAPPLPRRSGPQAAGGSAAPPRSPPPSATAPAHERDAEFHAAVERLKLPRLDAPLVVGGRAHEIPASLRAWVNDAASAPQQEARRLAAAKIEQSVLHGSAHIDLTTRSLFGPEREATALDALPSAALSLLNQVQLTVDPQTLSAAADAIENLRGVVALTCRGATRVPTEWPHGIQRLCLDDSPGIDLSNGIRAAGRLTELSLQRCALETLPDLSDLYFLHSLYLADNKLQSLHPSIGSLDCLQVLAVKNNELTTLPNIDGVRVLDMRDNAMRDFPTALNSAHHLQALFVRGDRKVASHARFKIPAAQLADDDLNAAIRDLDGAIEILREEWHGVNLPRSGSQWHRVDDDMFLPALVQSENKLAPGLGLKYADSFQAACTELTDLAAAATQAGSSRIGRIIADTRRSTDAESLDRLAHKTALQAIATPSALGTQVSVVIADSIDGELARVMVEEVSARLLAKGLRIGWTIEPLNVQSVERGCSIFSLSFAKKMQDNYPFLRHVHRDALSVSPNPEPEILPPAFYKHTNRRTMRRAVLDRMATDQRTAPVNKLGQTLSERIDAGDRTRQHDELGEITYNASIEAKRIQFFERAAWMYQEIARQRGLPLEPGITARTEVPTSSVLPLLGALHEPAGEPGPAPAREEGSA
jgi:YopJ Serine/Threonine acetyltransferase